MAIDLPPTPGLASFRANLPSWTVERSIEYLIALFRRRQIRGPKPCALATAWLLRKVISTTRASDPSKLVLRVQEVGRKLIASAPRELSVGNIVRRVLGAIREEEENRDQSNNTGSSEFGSVPPTPAAEIPQPILSVTGVNGPNSPRRNDPLATRPQMFQTPTGRPAVTSMFSILSHPTMRNGSGAMSPNNSGSSTPLQTSQTQPTDFRAEILEALTELIDELDQAIDQIASYSLEHIASQEIVFTNGCSATVQRFLVKAASKRKFTVIHAEAYPNEHKRTQSTVSVKKVSAGDEDEEEELDTDAFTKPLTTAGCQVILVPDSAIWALLPRASKVILEARAVLQNGSIVASAGSKALCLAAKAHRVPVIALASTYQLSPLYPYDPFEFIDYGDVQQVVPYQDRELQEGLASVRNPVTDFVESENIDLVVTNVGAVSTGFVYRTVRDQYHDEDVEI